jgi:hypothetical protein
VYEQERRRDPVARIALLIAIVCAVGMVVAVPSLLPTPVRDILGLGAERLADPRTAGPGGSFAFLAVQPNDPDEPVGYDPCKPIRLVINPADGPEGGEQLVLDAMEHVEELTGLRFSYEGVSDEPPRTSDSSTVVFSGGQVKAPPALVGWADEDVVEELEGDVAGIGGSASVETRGRLRYVTGSIVLDAELFSELMDDDGGREEARAIVLHELGHLLGLAHVQDGAELMNEENFGLLEYGKGDLNGLAKLGAIPCA